MRSHPSSAAEQRALEWARPGLVAGVDEVGRGPLAGPVVAAAVILDPRHPITGLRDSKALTALARNRLDAIIRDRALCLCIAEASVPEIDRLDILQATLLAMKRAIEGLRLEPARVLVDGNCLPRVRMAAEAIVKGDATVPAIAAASIVAKVYRDRLCDEMARAVPGYGFEKHKGYGTPAHLDALARLGPTPWHRRSFAPVRACLESRP